MENELKRLQESNQIGIIPCYLLADKLDSITHKCFSELNTYLALKNIDIYFYNLYDTEGFYTMRMGIRGKNIAFHLKNLIYDGLSYRLDLDERITLEERLFILSMLDKTIKKNYIIIGLSEISFYYKKGIDKDILESFCWNNFSQYTSEFKSFSIHPSDLSDGYSLINLRRYF